METNKERIEKILTRKSDKTMLRRYTDVLNIQASGTVSSTDQERLLNHATDIEKGLCMMIEGIEYYCRGTTKDWGDQAIGEDYVLAPEIGSIINGLIGLLNGPGHFDGGSCDGALRAIAKLYKIEDVEV